MAEIATKKTPRDLLRVVFRRRWLFLIGAALFAIGTLIAAHTLRREYTAVTKFERRSDVAAPQTVQGNPEDFQTIKLTLEHELIGFNAVARVVDELPELTRGLPRDASGRLTEAGQRARLGTIRGLQASMQVRWEVRSRNVDLVSLSVTHSDPKLAQEIPDALVKNYMEAVSEHIKARLNDSRKFLDKKVQGCERRVKEVTESKIKFESDHAGGLVHDPGLLQERIRNRQSVKDTLRRQKRAAEQRLRQLALLRYRATTLPTSQPVEIVRGPNPELKRLTDDLRATQENLRSAMMRMTEKHPTIKVLRQRIVDLEQRIKDTPPEVVMERVFRTDDLTPQAFEAQIEVQMADAKVELETLNEEFERVSSLLDGDEALMKDFAKVRQAYLEITSALGRETEELHRWRQKLMDVSMSLEAEVAKRGTHLDAKEAAQKQFRPSSPNLLMIIAFAVAGGLAFGGGLVFLTNMLDRTITTAEDAAKYFDVPVHGVIGEIVTRKDQALRTMKRWLLGPAISMVLIVSIAVSMFSIVLRVRYPDKYEEWKASPPDFVLRVVTDPTAWDSGT